MLNIQEVSLVSYYVYFRMEWLVYQSIKVKYFSPLDVKSVYWLELTTNPTQNNLLSNFKNCFSRFY